MDFLNSLLQFAATSSTGGSTSLRIDPKWFVSGSSNAVYNLWQYMQGAANIILIIFFLIIVFSQLTGLGIDNYGVKKALPKLVISAIIINLSFVICTIAVDISNLIGSGIYNWLDTVRGNVGSYSTADYAQFGFYGLFTGLLGLTAGAAGVAGTVLSVAGGVSAITAIGWPIIIIGLVVALLIAIIAVCFVFIMLAAREIMCMVLVAISPLAFICYALPNTKKLFDKWLNMFKSLLMVYPIIAGMFAGAKLIRKVIILQSGNFWEILIGMCLPWVPFFLIPSILKKALGAVGSMLDNLKNKATGGVKALGQATARSNFMQQANADSLEKRQGKLSALRQKLDTKQKGAKTNFGRKMYEYAGGAVGMQALQNQGIIDNTKKKANDGQGITNAYASGIELDEEDENGKKKLYFKDQDGNWIDSKGKKVEDEQTKKKLDGIEKGEFTVPDTVTDSDGKKWSKDADGKWTSGEGEEKVEADETKAKELNALQEDAKQEALGHRVKQNGKMSKEAEKALNKKLTEEGLDVDGENYKLQADGKTWKNKDGVTASGDTLKALKKQKKKLKKNATSISVDELDEQLKKEGLDASDSHHYQLQTDGEGKRTWKDEAGNEASAAIAGELDGKRDKMIRDGNRTYQFKEVDIDDGKGNKSRQRRWVRKNQDGSEDVIDGEELKSVEAAAAKNRTKAIGGRRVSYHSDGAGGLEDAAGNKLDEIITKSIFASGAYQTGSNLHAVQRQMEYERNVNTLSSYAGQNANQLAHAAGINAETSARTQLNQTIGQANAIQDVRMNGGIPEITQLAAGQNAIRQYQAAASGNISAAVTLQSNLDTQAQKIAEATNRAMKDAINKFGGSAATQQLSMDQKLELINSAKAGKLDKIAADTTRSDLVRSVAQTMISDYGGARQFVGAGSAEIKERIDNSLVNLIHNQSAIDTQQKFAIMSAAQKGRLEQDIINSPNSSPEMVQIAQRMMEKNGGSNDFSGFSSSEFKNIIDATAMGQNVATKIGTDIPARGTGVMDDPAAKAYVERATAEARVQAASEIGLTGLTQAQVTNAVATGSVRAQNQFKQETVGNAVGEVELDTDVATHQAKQSKTIKQQDQQAYADILKGDIPGVSSEEEVQEIQNNVTLDPGKVYNQSKRKIFVTAATNGKDVESPEWKTIKSDIDSRRQNEHIVALEAEISRERDDQGRRLSDSMDGLGRMAMEAARTGDNDRLMATVNIMTKKGEAGQEYVHDIMGKLSDEGLADAEYVVASHIINNYGSEYKNNSRSTFDRAQAIIQGNAGVWDSTVATNVNSLKSSSIATANDAEIDRYINALQKGILTEDEAIKLANAINDALDTPNIKGSMKQGQIEKFDTILDLVTRPGARFATRSVNSDTNQDPPSSQGHGGAGAANPPINGTTGGGFGGGPGGPGGPGGGFGGGNPGGGFGGGPGGPGM